MIVFSAILIANIFLWSERLPYSLRMAIDSFIVPFSAYFVSRRLVQSEYHLAQLLRVYAYLGVFIILFGLAERMTSSNLLLRLYGPFRSGTEYYSALTVIFYTALLAHLLGSVRARNGIILPVAARRFVIALSPVIVLLTWSRGNWLGFLLSAGLFGILGWRLMPRSRTIAWLSVATLALGLGVFSLPSFELEGAVGHRVLNTNTVDWRLERWAIALNEGAQHPIFGIGFKNLQNELAGQLGAAYGAHNFFLASFAELGLSGLIAYLIVIASVIRTGLHLYKRGVDACDRWRGAALIAVVTSHLVPSLFANAVESTNLTLIYLYALIGAIVSVYNREVLVASPVNRAARPLVNAYAIPKHESL
jgi:O-antigen ligase